MAHPDPHDLGREGQGSHGDTQDEGLCHDAPARLHRPHQHHHSHHFHPHPRCAGSGAEGPGAEGVGPTSACDPLSAGGFESRSRNRRRLGAILGLTVLYMVVEVIGGLATNSLALLADAGHMLSDAGALALSFFAIWIADRRAPPQRTYGYHRSEILAALVNGAVLIALAILIVVEAMGRFGAPPRVDGPIMLAVAAGGLAVNGAGLLILRHGKDESLNVRGAWLHVLTDALGSVGALISAALIWGFDWRMSDPIASVLIALLVMYSAWPLLKQTLAVLMESAPGYIDVAEVREAMVEVAGVDEVHDLHVWTITQGLDCLSGHVVTLSGVDHQAVLRELRALLRSRFGIDHVTLQMEQSGFEEHAVCDHAQEART